MNAVSIGLFELLGRRVLVTRESARKVQHVLDRALETSAAGVEIDLDFSNIEAITPSFIDEALHVVTEITARDEGKGMRLVFMNLPTRLSEKFVAVARAHDLVVTEEDDKTWIITRN
ncbi:MAG: DUF4325 domain-containing protein [Dehalococcoidia bacterium]